jgi:hypothetical protein
MITIIESPNNWQNLFNEIVIGVSGGNSTQPNYQFLCDVHVSGQSNPVTRLTLPKQPLVGTVQINVADIVKNYVTFDFGGFISTIITKEGGFGFAHAIKILTMRAYKRKYLPKKIEIFFILAIVSY